MRKRGQLQISFGMIFSIIIIIATLSIAGYVIVKFISTDYKIECALFYQNLQNKLDQSWQSDGSVSYLFSDKIPTKTDKVCFGYNNQTLLNKDDDEEYSSAQIYSGKSNNLFFYPIAACGNGGASYRLNHAKTDNFFCVNVENGKATVRLTKSSTDNVVKLSK